MQPPVKRLSEVKVSRGIVGIVQKVFVISATVAAGVWISSKLAPGIKASGGRIEDAVLAAQAKSGKPMWDPRNPQTAADMADPGKSRKLEETTAASEATPRK